MILSGSIPSISLDRWRQNHAKSVQNHGTVIAMNEEVPLVTEPQPRLNSWTLNKGWIIIGTAWCTTIHHYSDMKPFIGHNGRNTHLVLVLLGTQQLWEKLKVWIFCIWKLQIAKWKKRCSKSWEMSGFDKRWTEPSKKTRIWLNKSQIEFNIRCLFQIFSGCKMIFPKPPVFAAKTLQHFQQKTLSHCHQDAVRPWAPTIK